MVYLNTEVPGGEQSAGDTDRSSRLLARLQGMLAEADRQEIAALVPWAAAHEDLPQLLQAVFALNKQTLTAVDSAVKHWLYAGSLPALERPALWMLVSRVECVLYFLGTITAVSELYDAHTRPFHLNAALTDEELLYWLCTCLWYFQGDVWLKAWTLNLGGNYPIFGG